jgi:hypothetical protein
VRIHRQQPTRTSMSPWAVLLLLPVLALAGCSSSPSSTSVNSGTTVTIDPLYNPTVGTGEAILISASSFTPTDATPEGVSFTLTCTGATGAGCGTLASPTISGVTYDAPASVSGTVNVTVTATSVSTPSVSASLSFPVITTVFTATPVGPVTVDANKSITIVTTLNPDPGLTNTSYSLSGNACSSATCGTMTVVPNTNGKNYTYTAPGSAVPLIVQITLSPAADPSISQTITVNVPPNVDSFNFTPAILPVAIAGATSYSQTITISGGTAPYTVDILTSTVPSWVTSLLPAGNSNVSTVSLNNQTYYQFTTNGQFTVSGAVPVSSTKVNDTTDQPLPVVPADLLFSTTDSAGASSTNGLGLDIYSAYGTSNALLNGTYVFSGLGFQDGTTIANAQRLGYIGQFTADGNGNITGYMDINETGATYSEAIRGNYEVNSNQTGLMTIQNDGDAPTPIAFAITLGGVSGTNGSAARGSFVEYDDITGNNGSIPKNTLCCGGTRAQGPILQQSSSVVNAATNSLVGSYAFAMNGRNPQALAGIAAPSAGTCMISSSTANPTCGPAAVAGAVAFSSSGAITGGEQDVTQGETTINQIGIEGGFNSSGKTDAYGRATAVINATTGATGLNDWPSDYVIYEVNPSTFFAMSTDPYSADTLLEGEGIKQNLADIQSEPFSGTNNIIVYGSSVSPQNFFVDTTSQGTSLNGASTASQQQLLPVLTGTTTGTMSGMQYVQYSGATDGFSSPQSAGTTTPTVGGTPYYEIPQFNYTVDSYGRVSNNSPQIGIGVSSSNPVGITDNIPILYLTDTDSGLGVATGITGAGIYVVQQQTIAPGTSLSAGTYSWFNSFPNSQTAPFEAGSIIFPAGGAPNAASASTNVNITGQAYQSYFSTTYDEGDGGPLLFATPITGTISFENDQMTGFSVTGGIQACSGHGFAVTSTEFLCFPSTTGYTSIQVFQQ